MSTLTLHTTETAPEASRATLEGVEKKLGFLPNLFATFADSPALLEGYVALDRNFSSKSDLDATEQQIVLITVSVENECAYCVAGHTVISSFTGVPDEVVRRLREGEPLEDPKHEALRVFTRTLVRERGWASEADVEAFLAAGYEKRHVLDVILGIAVKTISNFTNHVSGTPLDEAFSAAAWTPPSKR